MEFVRIHQGRHYSGAKVKNVVDVDFPLVDATLKTSTNGRGKYIKVNGESVKGFPKGNFKMFVANQKAFTVVDEAGLKRLQREDRISEVARVPNRPPEDDDIPTDALVLHGDDDYEIKQRIGKRFQILQELIWAAGDNHITGLVVHGPPGVGKSFGVMAAMSRGLEMNKLMNELIDPTMGDPDEPTVKIEKPQPINHIVVSGHITPRGLYETLYEYRNKGDVVVFDDCDGILQQEHTLNYLKKVMQTGKQPRVLSWIKSADRPEGNVPDRFTFDGAVVFITNIDFERPARANSSIAEHLEAILDRIHYLDLTINTLRERFLRIDQVCRDYGLLKELGLDYQESDDVMKFFEANIENFTKVSIRTAEKLAPLRLHFPDWQETAAATLFRTGRKPVLLEP